jgi:hypothetical protein
MARIINEAAMNQRADVRKLNDSLVDEMKGKGLAFNNADADSFRAKLRSAGFYAEWKRSSVTSPGPCWRSTPASWPERSVCRGSSCMTAAGAQPSP